MSITNNAEHKTAVVDVTRTVWVTRHADAQYHSVSTFFLIFFQRQFHTVRLAELVVWFGAKNAVVRRDAGPQRPATRRTNPGTFIRLVRRGRVTKIPGQRHDVAVGRARKRPATPIYNQSLIYSSNCGAGTSCDDMSW